MNVSSEYLALLFSQHFPNCTNQDRLTEDPIVRVCRDTCMIRGGLQYEIYLSAEVVTIEPEYQSVEQSQ